MATGNNLAIVPARGGSKRLVKKNLRMLGGKPLVCHTLDAAQESGRFSKIILSSDDAEILNHADHYSIVERHCRPPELSGDHVTALTLVCKLIADPAIHERYDTVALLLPTAPFRNSSDIQEGFKLLDDEIDGVVSLTQYEFPPQLSVALEKGEIKPVFDPCPLITGNTRSQDQAAIYRPNGAFYIQWMQSFLANQNFWKGRVRGYVMPRSQSVDIDTISDLEYAQFLMEK